MLIPSRDLKFFVHSGSYVVRRIGRTEELTGADVVLVHRLLKGSAREVVGNDAYLVLTRAVLDGIGGNAAALGLTEHVEHLDIGDTDVFIESLQERWEAEETSGHQAVSPESALTAIGADMPATLQEMWSWYTNPRKRVQWQEGLTRVTEAVDGRRGVGTVNHCAHGGGVTIQHVLDWQPFTSFTTRDEVQGAGLVVTVTYVFTPVEGGTNATAYFTCDPEQAWPQVEAVLSPNFGSANQRLIGMPAAQAEST